VSLLQALSHLLHAAVGLWTWARCLVLHAAEKVFTRHNPGEVGHLARASITKMTPTRHLRLFAQDKAWSLISSAGGTMDLLLIVTTLGLLFVGMWLLRRRALPAPIRARPARANRAHSPRVRLVSSGESELARRAVTLACTGTPAELQSVLTRLAQRAPLAPVDAGAAQKPLTSGNDCPYCAGRTSDPPRGR